MPATAGVQVRAAAVEAASGLELTEENVELVLDEVSIMPCISCTHKRIATLLVRQARQTLGPPEEIRELVLDEVSRLLTNIYY